MRSQSVRLRPRELSGRSIEATTRDTPTAARCANRGRQMSTAQFAHKCKLMDSSQNALRIVRESTRGK